MLSAPPPDVYSARDIAAAAGVSEARVRALMARGQIRSIALDDRRAGPRTSRSSSRRAKPSAPSARWPPAAPWRCRRITGSWPRALLRRPFRRPPDRRAADRLHQPSRVAIADDPVHRQPRVRRRRRAHRAAQGSRADASRVPRRARPGRRGRWRRLEDEDASAEGRAQGHSEDQQPASGAQAAAADGARPSDRNRRPRRSKPRCCRR